MHYIRYFLPKEENIGTKRLKWLTERNAEEASFVCRRKIRKGRHHYLCGKTIRTIIVYISAFEK